jgi:hypothetical protein
VGETSLQCNTSEGGRTEDVEIPGKHRAIRRGIKVLLPREEPGYKREKLTRKVRTKVPPPHYSLMGYLNKHPTIR